MKIQLLIAFALLLAGLGCGVALLAAMGVI